MELSEVVAPVFSVIFILILYFFIFRALRLMRRDVDGPKELIGEDASQWGLQVVETGSGSALRKGTVIPLRSGMTFGREQDNSVVLFDPYISFYHMRLFASQGRYIIEDLDSTNGTFFIGKRLKGKVYLDINDQITLGSIVLRVIN